MPELSIVINLNGLIIIGSLRAAELSPPVMIYKVLTKKLSIYYYLLIFYEEV